MKITYLFKGIYHGKSLARILLNWHCREYLAHLEGKVIDLGSGSGASYHKYLSNKAELIKTDGRAAKNLDAQIDLNDQLKIPGNFFDNAILFNVLYILKDPSHSLKEINRILKPGGKLLLSTPLIFNESPEPVDYWRFTFQGLRIILEQSGFKNIKIIRMGERFSSGVMLINPWQKLGFLNYFLYPLALLLDKLLPKKIKEFHPCPLGYLVVCEK
ncbi:hypothetical protein COV56_01075 [Candidatus Kuenenbacteria bacterium CG11_big_fil_rev_8_21_14_0_20_37_9]|nr:MAG: hypothetical protein COV56_01075 [Candidatus Kuenenbacteria bacterium CG11_big_fil_rev_8_21_14_0_20_37_9]